jgi:pyruvate dehydrogenase E2 component (dihydrolipoamide acetyltransferase)
MTYEADQDGTLSIVAQEGDTLPVGETIARIGEGGGSGEDSGGDEDEEEPQDESGEDAGDEDEDEPEAEEDEEPEAEETADEDAEEEDEDEPEAEEDTDEPEAEEDEEPEAEEEDEPKAEGDGGSGNGRVKASPIARRMAREMGLELASVKGSGPGGRIVKADVEAAAKSGEKPQEDKREEKEPEKQDKRAPAPAGDSGRGEIRHQDLTRLQRTVARRMAESKATAPDFVISLEVDMEEAVELRKQLKAAAGDAPAPSFNDFVVKASALALRDFPRANGAYRDGAFELYSRVNVGVAVAGQDALVVPTVFDADKKSLGTIATEARALAEKVREGKITPPELSAGTFTVSNLGMYGIRRFVAVINPPQAAILAVGELTPRPVVRDGEVTVRAIMELTLSCDHRILYGADAAEFLARIREYLETPLRLAL